MSADGVGHGAEDFARKLLVDDRHARRILVVVPLERAKVRSFLRLWLVKLQPTFLLRQSVPAVGFCDVGDHQLPASPSVISGAADGEGRSLF
jgi:hypothetical protein